MGSNQVKDNTDLSGLRAALLNWYPFPGGKRALLLGANTGPLSEILNRYYTQTDTNTDIFARYDCIVAVDAVEETDDPAGLMLQLYDLLCDGGVFLLAFRNRFGLKYLCGSLDEYVKKPFDSLTAEQKTPRLYSKNEMQDMLTAVGFCAPRYYYLMPDSSFVQAVYTDDHLPDDSIRDRVMPFDLFDSPLIAWESDLYDDMVREGTLPNVANVYLAECRKPGTDCTDKRVIYAALSTDRGEEHGFATVLYSNGTALKKNLYPSGRKALEALFENLESIRRQGLLTVPQKLTSDGIVMPLIKEESLLHYLKRMLCIDSEAFLNVFTVIEEDVLRSSRLSEIIPDKMETIWGEGSEKLGPILENAWIDMIPYNAFWADGKIRYYDQEFKVENCPAKYVLFRALFYTWIHIPEAESCLPLDSVKERFGLTELWEGFKQREMRFVCDNRNWDSLAEIYAHNYPDRKEIKQRREELALSASLRDIHAVQMELLREFDRVCKSLGLTYMAIHGTLLGAVRHKGFIPWDEDVDLAMPRADYDRLLASTNSFGPGYFLQTAANNTGCFYGGYIKLRRDGTAAYEEQNTGKSQKSCHQGIWIDIFPLDNCPEKESSQKQLQKMISFMQRLVYAKVYPIKQFVPDDVPGTRVSFYYLLKKCVRRRWLLKWIDMLCRSTGKSQYRAILECYYGAKKNRNVWPKEAVDFTIEMPFENINIPVPIGWEEILKSRYGEDYMTPHRSSIYNRHKKIIFITETESEQNG